MIEIASPRSSDDGAEVHHKSKSPGDIDLPGLGTPTDYDSDAEWERLRYETSQLRSLRTGAIPPEEQLMEDRLRWVERKLRKLDGKAKQKQAESEKNGANEASTDEKADSKDADEFYKTNARIGVIPEFRKVDWYNFKVSSSSMQRALLNVL